MKTFFKWTAGIVIAAVLVVLMVPGPVVKFAVEKVGSRVLATDVSVDNVSISLWRGTGLIENLRVANPEGFEQPDAMSLGRLSYAVDPMSLLSDTIHVGHIKVTDLAMTFEMAGRQSNLKALQNNMAKATSSDQAADSPQKEASADNGDAKAGKNVRIDLVEINNPRVTVAVANLPVEKASVSLGSVKLTNIGGENGTSPAKAVEQIFAPLIQTAQNVSLSKLRDLGANVESQVRERADEMRNKLNDKVGDFLSGR